MEKKEFLESTILDSSTRLFNKLKRLNYDDLQLSDFQRYRFKQISFENIQKFSFLLKLALDNRENNFRDLVLVDYGGGAGLMSLLAKEIGINTVIYTDIDKQSSHDAKIIGEILKIPADFYLSGDIDKLIDLFINNDLNCDVLISYDVLEHIYDIVKYLKQLKFLSTKAFRLVMASGANQYNPIIKRSIVHRQYEIERHGRARWVVNRDIDYKGSYFTARKDIIKKYHSEIDDEIIECLAKRTRGMKIDVIGGVKFPTFGGIKIPT